MSILFGELGNPIIGFDAIKKEFRSIWAEQELHESDAPAGARIATGQVGGFFPEIKPVYMPDQQRMFALSGYIWTDEGFPLVPETASQSVIQAGNRLIDQDCLDLPDLCGDSSIQGCDCRCPRHHRLAKKQNWL